LFTHVMWYHVWLSFSLLFSRFKCCRLQINHTTSIWTA
jgi:hypothetical protein